MTTLLSLLTVECSSVQVFMADCLQKKMPSKTLWHSEAYKRLKYKTFITQKIVNFGIMDIWQAGYSSLLFCIYESIYKLLFISFIQSIMIRSALLSCELNPSNRFVVLGICISGCSSHVQSHVRCVLIERLAVLSLLRSSCLRLEEFVHLGTLSIYHTIYQKLL